MDYRLLGNSGLRVSELALGALTFGEESGFGMNRKESQQVFEHFVAAGGNFFDTADIYNVGTSERFLGEFIRREREKYIVATKYSGSTGDGVARSGNNRKNMMQALEASLKRLGTDYIDLYYVHFWDFMTPIEEVMRGFDDLIRTGKVHYIGLSDTPAWIVARAQTMAELKGWAPLAALQIEYSLAERTPERDLLPVAKALDLTVVPWGPLRAGILTGKYNNPQPNAPRRRSMEEVTERELAIAQTLIDIGRESGHSASQIALAWILHQNRNQPVVPIFSARNLAQLKDNLGCLEVRLDPEHIEKLDAISRIDLGFPHEFLARPVMRDIMTGGLDDRIHNHRK